MAFAGLDLHKSYCQAIECTSEGKVLKEGRIPTEKEEIEEFFGGLEHLEIALEASSNYEYYYEGSGSGGLIGHTPVRRTRWASRVTVLSL